MYLEIKEGAKRPRKCTSVPNGSFVCSDNDTITTCFHSHGGPTTQKTVLKRIDATAPVWRAAGKRARAEDRHWQCKKSSRTGHHFTFQVQKMNAEVKEFVDMGFFDTRIHDNTDISWVIDAISHQIAWPLGYFKIVVGTRPLEYVHRLKDRDCTLLQDLREECLQEGTINSEDPLPITLVLHCPPETFDNNMGRGSFY